MKLAEFHPGLRSRESRARVVWSLVESMGFPAGETASIYEFKS